MIHEVVHQCFKEGLQSNNQGNVFGLGEELVSMFQFSEIKITDKSKVCVNIKVRVAISASPL